MGRTKRVRKHRHDYNLPSAKVHHDLYKFLSIRGWRNIDQSLTVSAFPQTGRGLFAKKNLSEHDLIIELPHQCLISYLTLENDDDFTDLFEKDKLETSKSLISFQSLLALYLHHQILKKDSSEWISYIQTLPESFSVPYFCKKSELYYLPDFLLEKIVEQNEIIKRNFQELMKLMKSKSSENFSLETFKWAYFVCNSRSIYIKGEVLKPLVECMHFEEILIDSPNMALAPLLDLLNHSDQAETKSQLSHSDRFIAENAEKIKINEVRLTYQLHTVKKVESYQQIFINYGAHNNTKLLLEYGFVIPNNQMDFLEFCLSDINSYIKSHSELKTLLIPKHKYKFIRDHNLDEQMFIDSRDGLNHNFQAVLAILLVPQNLYNLTQVAFGDELNFSNIKQHALEILKQKKIEMEKFIEGLIHQNELSGSGKACLEYFTESNKLVNKVLGLVENSCEES